MLNGLQFLQNFKISLFLAIIHPKRSVSCVLYMPYQQKPFGICLR